MKNKSKTRKWFPFFVILIFIVFIAIQFIKIERETVKTNDLTCIQDSDCVVKSNGVNCPQVFRFDDLSEPQVMIPPPHTICPESEDARAYCNQGTCSLKMDCSKCDTLRKKWYGDYCKNNYNMDGSSRTTCAMYFACGC